MEMLKTVRQAFKVPEMRKKIIFTVLMLIVFRIGSNIPVPGINRQALADVFGNGKGLFDLFDLFSGGSFSNFTVFALSITPYITAQIIIQLLTVAFPYFERLAKEGMEGRKKMMQITRYMTVVLAVIQALGLTLGLFGNAVVNKSAFHLILIVLTLTAGTSFLMWLGEQVNQYGVGDGISLLIMGGILARIPKDIRSMSLQYKQGSVSFLGVLLFALFAFAVIIGIIYVQQGTRKIPVQYAKRVVGRKMYGGQSTHIPMKVNQAGVIPVIFAISLLQFPQTITYFLSSGSKFTAWVGKYLSTSGSPGVWVFSICNILLIIIFNYFYTAVTFNPAEVSKEMKANGGFVPGIRPGKPTTDYLTKVMARLSLVGALFLAAIATLPTIVMHYMNLPIYFGGTSLLIAVGVSLDVMRGIENQMLARKYRGFLK